MNKNKFYIFCSIIIILPLICFSQTKGLINYGYIESLPNGNSKGMDYNAFLVFNKQMSNYVTAKDSLEKSERKNQEKISEDEEGNISISSGIKLSNKGDQVVNHLTKKTMWSSLYFKEIIYVKEVTPKITWKITKETKKIGKFKCIKATANFRGRDYTAWFTTTISLPYGPWKLNGLPGLILEAYDTNKHVYWYFKNIEYPSLTKENVKYLKIPVRNKIYNYIEYKAFQKLQIEKNIESQRLIKKDYPNIVFEEPKIQYLFIECE